MRVWEVLFLYEEIVEAALDVSYQFICLTCEERTS
jgi:hypothetical protein